MRSVSASLISLDCNFGQVISYVFHFIKMVSDSSLRHIVKIRYDVACNILHSVTLRLYPWLFLLPYSLIAYFSILLVNICIKVKVLLDSVLVQNVYLVTSSRGKLCNREIYLKSPFCRGFLLSLEIKLKLIQKLGLTRTSQESLGSLEWIYFTV